MTRWVTCPECRSTQEVVGLRTPTFRRHSTADLDLCPGSEQPPPEPQRPQGGWRVRIETREHGPIVGPVRVGQYDERVAAGDERALRLGRHGRSTVGIGCGVELLTPDDVADLQADEHAAIAIAREMDDVHADLARARGGQ